MKHIGEYKGYKVYQTNQVQDMNPNNIYSVPSSSGGYDAIYLGSKVGHFDSVYCVDWFSQEKVDELYKMWMDAEVERAREAAIRASTPKKPAMAQEKLSESTVEEQVSALTTSAADFWNNLTKKIEEVLASVK